MRRYITLPSGKACSLPVYCAAWVTLKTLDPEAEIGSWECYPVKAREILRELRAGLHDRINRRDPRYGRGRKWDPRYQLDLQRDARMVGDYARHRVVMPQRGLNTPELQRRFQWHYSSSEGLSIVLHNKTPG